MVTKTCHTIHRWAQNKINILIQSDQNMHLCNIVNTLHVSYGTIQYQGVPVLFGKPVGTYSTGEKKKESYTKKLMYYTR